MSNLERVKIEDLNVGDVVCIAREVHHNWTIFRHHKYQEGVVERITPKKTKAVVKGYGDCDRYTPIYRPSEETKRLTDIANKFIYLCNSVYRLRNEVRLTYLSDEEIVELASKFKEINDILEKSNAIKKED